MSATPLIRAATVLVLAAAASTGPASAVVAGPAPASPPVSRLSWAACGDGFECSTARVPLDYDRPHGRRIDIALIRLPAADPDRRIGSLFVNPGGPGNSGVTFVREAALSAYPAGVRARYDIVGMDPRGVGSSTAVRCFADAGAREAFFADYDVLPTGPDELAAQVRRVTDLADRCQARAGWLLPHVSTANVARDLDLLRAAVGDDRLSYAGYSYGTYLGATYAALFPGRVGALVLDANSYPPAYATGPRRSVPFLRVNAHLGSAETLDQFFALCAGAGPRCDFAQGGDPRTKYATLARRLRETPLALPDGRVIGYAELVDVTVQSLYNAEGWAAAAATLQQLYAATTPPAGARGAASQDDNTQYDNTLEALLANVCSETDNPRNPYAYAGIAARADREAPYVGAFWAYLSLPCAVWPARDADRYTGSWRLRTDRGALVLNTRWDPATPHRNAVRMARLLPGSRLVTVEGWGHTARDTRSPCAQAILERYLVDGVLPPRGTTCAPGVVPFT